MSILGSILLFYTVAQSVVVSARGCPGSTCISPVWLERCKPSLSLSPTLMPLEIASISSLDSFTGACSWFPCPGCCCGSPTHACVSTREASQCRIVIASQLNNTMHIGHSNFRRLPKMARLSRPSAAQGADKGWAKPRGRQKCLLPNAHLSLFLYLPPSSRPYAEETAVRFLFRLIEAEPPIPNMPTSHYLKLSQYLCGRCTCLGATTSSARLAGIDVVYSRLSTQLLHYYY